MMAWKEGGRTIDWVSQSVSEDERRVQLCGVGGAFRMGHPMVGWLVGRWGTDKVQKTKPQPKTKTKEALTLRAADQLAPDVDEGQLLGARQLLDGVQARLAPVVVRLDLVGRDGAGDGVGGW